MSFLSRPSRDHCFHRPIKISTGRVFQILRARSIQPKGRTIRKVMGGRGIFSLHDFFFRPLLVQEFFLQVKPSTRIFFFRQILLCLSFTN